LQFVFAQIAFAANPVDAPTDSTSNEKEGRYAPPLSDGTQLFFLAQIRTDLRSYASGQRSARKSSERVQRRQAIPRSHGFDRRSVPYVRWSWPEQSAVCWLLHVVRRIIATSFPSAAWDKQRK